MDPLLVQSQPLKRVSYNGITPASQADNEGSIPFTRSIQASTQHPLLFPGSRLNLSRSSSLPNVPGGIYLRLAVLDSQFACYRESSMNPTTPDGRYFVVKGQLWRCSNPGLAEDVRQRLVNELMKARRQVKTAKAAQDATLLKAAREQVQAAKVALGERGPVWWSDGSPDFNRYRVVNTPYANWYAALGFES